MPLPSATLDFAPELELNLLSRFGRIAAIDVEGRPAGLVGAITPVPALITQSR